MLLNEASRPQKTKPFRFKNHFTNKINFDFNKESRPKQQNNFVLIKTDLKKKLILILMKHLGQKKETISF